VVDGPGELLVQDAIWGDPEDGDEEEYVPLPAEVLAAEAAPGYHRPELGPLCGRPNAKGRPCGLLASDCNFHGSAAAETLEAAEARAAEARAAAEAREIRAQVRAALGPRAEAATIAAAVPAAARQRTAARRTARETLLRKARGEGSFPWTSVSS